MKGFQKMTTALFLIGAALIVVLHTTGLSIGERYYYCKLIKWPANANDWPSPFYHDALDGPTGSNESFIVYGIRINRWSWQFGIQH